MIFDFFFSIVVVFYFFFFFGKKFFNNLIVISSYQLTKVGILIQVQSCFSYNLGFILID